MYLHRNIHPYEVTHLFKSYCTKGQNQHAKDLWTSYHENNGNSMYKIDLHDQNDEILKISCKNGRVSIVKWIWQLAIDIELEFKIQQNIQHAFYFSCLYCHIELVEWFWDLFLQKKIHLTADALTIQYYMLRITSKSHGGIEKKCLLMLQFLKKNCKEIIDIHCNEDELFTNCISKGHFQIAKWLIAVTKDTPIKITNEHIELCDKLGAKKMKRYFTDRL